MSTASPTSHQSANIGAGSLVLGISAAVIIAMLTYDGTYGSQNRASIAQQRSGEIEREHVALCIKLGFVHGGTTFMSCTRDIADFRQRVERRFAQETSAY
jgi:hypothetical protein